MFPLDEAGLRWLVVDEDAVAFLRETRDERVLVVVARAPWSGAVLPRWLAPDGEAQGLHGSGLRVDQSGVHLAGDGPGVGVWRLR